MQSTTSSSGRRRPCCASCSAAAVVTPPAVSAKMPVVSASSRIPATSSASETAAAQPPVSVMARAAVRPSAGLPIASDRAIGRRDLRLDAATATLDEPNDRRAARRLCAVDARQRALEQAGVQRNSRNPRWSFVTSAPPAMGATTARRRAPAELLDDLERHRLGAFAVVRAQVHVHQSPPEAVGHLRAEPVHVVVRAAHAHQVRPKTLVADDLGRLEVVRDEDPGGEAGARRVRRDGVGEVASGRASDDVEPERTRRVDRCGHDAVLEGQRRDVRRRRSSPTLAQRRVDARAPAPRRAA